MIRFLATMSAADTLGLALLAWAVWSRTTRMPYRGLHRRGGAR